MINWLQTQENYLQTLFHEWKNHSLDAFQQFSKKYPFLELSIHCNFSKDDWLRHQNASVNYEVKFHFKNVDTSNFLPLLRNLFAQYEPYEQAFKEILDTQTKPMTWLEFSKKVCKINGEKYQASEWDWNLSSLCSMHDTYSDYEEDNELDGLRFLLGQYGLITNSWFTVLDKSRNYDVEFTIDKNQLTIHESTAETKNNKHEERAYGFNGLEETMSL